MGSNRRHFVPQGNTNKFKNLHVHGCCVKNYFDLLRLHVFYFFIFYFILFNIESASQPTRFWGVWACRWEAENRISLKYHNIAYIT